MKRTIMICLMVIIYFSVLKAQNNNLRVDSLANLYKEISAIENRLNNFNIQYRTGTKFIMTGLIVNSLGLLVSNMKSEIFIKLIHSNITLIGLQ